ncbi:MAG: aminotransferase class IV [Myxococcota bacterium]
MIRVWVDGRITAPEDARISVFDRGFLYGDSVYEVLRTVRGEPLDLADHLERLARSAERIAIALPRTLGAIDEAVRATLKAAGNDDAYVRIVVTRGAGEIDLDPASARGGSLVVIAKPLKMPPSELFERGAAVAIVHVRRNARQAVDPAVKSGNYLNNILALAEARARGCYEAIMCDADGAIAEGASSNVFVVAGGVVRTPPLDVGLLEGITRRKVLESCARAGMQAREDRFFPDDLRGADEAFLTSSIRGVMPVVRVDTSAIADGRPGPVTRRLMALYAQRLS